MENSPNMLSEEKSVHLMPVKFYLSEDGFELWAHDEWGRSWQIGERHKTRKDALRAHAAALNSLFAASVAGVHSQ